MGVPRSGAAGWLAVVLVAFVAGWPASASAAGPHKLGNGDQVRAAVSPDGTAHVVWTAHSPERYVYCRIPAGANDCDRKSSWTAPSGSIADGPAGVFALSSSRIVIAQYWCCGDETWTVESNNGGQGFGPLTMLADSSAAVTGSGESVFGPGDAVTAVEGSISTFGPYVQRSKLGAVNSTSTSALSPGGVGDSSLGFAGSKTVLAWSTPDNSGEVDFRVAHGGNLNQDGTWGPIRTAAVADGFGAIQIASGPSGLFMLNESAATGAPEVRGWDGSGFGPPTKLAPTGRFSELTQDPSGGLHAVWHPNVAGGDLLYRHSPDGSRWEPTVTLVPGADSSNAQPAVNQSGEGIVAYDSLGGEFFTRLPPPPSVGKSVDVAPVKGKVFVNTPGPGGFKKLKAGEQIPVGSKVDTTSGTVRLTAAKNRSGSKTEQADFSTGLFKVTQEKGGKHYTEVALLGKPSCGHSKGGHHARLYGSGHGHFRTHGHHGSGSTIGKTATHARAAEAATAAKGKTRWLTEERCSGTYFAVAAGKLRVKDFTRHRTITLRKGQHYLAPAGK